jgi:hypothetical protein
MQIVTKPDKMLEILGVYRLCIKEMGGGSLTVIYDRLSRSR